MTGEYVMSDWRPDLIRRVQRHLTPEQVRVTVLTKNCRFFVSQVEEHFGTEYHVEKISDETIKAWRNCGVNEHHRWAAEHFARLPMFLYSYFFVGSSIPAPNDLIDRSGVLIDLPPVGGCSSPGIKYSFLDLIKKNLNSQFRCDHGPRGREPPPPHAAGKEEDQLRLHDGGRPRERERELGGRQCIDGEGPPDLHLLLPARPPRHPHRRRGRRRGARWRFPAAAAAEEDAGAAAHGRADKDEGLVSERLTLMIKMSRTIKPLSFSLSIC